MTTECLRYGIDGLVPAGTLPSDCCVPDICQIDPCAFVCNFLNYLPSGPLWDLAKELALQRLNDPCVNNCYTDKCVTIVNHAVYTANRLLHMIKGPLLTALVESNPYTAYYTKELWLKRLNWIDCFSSVCRNRLLGDITPVEIWCLRRVCFDTEPGSQMASMNGGYALSPTYVPVDYDPELTAAVQRGIIIALHRLQLRPVATIDNLNFALQELGAELTVIDAEDFDDAQQICYEMPSCNPCKDDGGISQMEACVVRFPRINLRICNSTTRLRKSIPPSCDFPQETPIGSRTTECSELDCNWVNAFHVPCDDIGLRPPKIWPGVLAAECIARYYLPQTANYTITRCCAE